MNKYIEYLKYVLKHKKNVFKVCWSKGMYLHAFTHDLSKFTLYEYVCYANWFYGEYGARLNSFIEKGDKSLPNYKFLNRLHRECEIDFKYAWQHHYTHNKHHWNYWIGKDIPVKYIKQMICDWEAMSMEFGGTAQEYYLKNYNFIIINDKTRLCLEYNLGLIQLLNGSFSECSWEANTPIYNTIKEYSKTEYGRKVLEEELFIKIDKKYNVNTLELIERD